MKKHHVNPARVIEYIIVYGYSLIVVVPLINILLCSFKTNEDINRVVTLPKKLDFTNYITVFNTKGTLGSFGNTIFITVVSISVSILICVLAAYPIARKTEKVFNYLYLYFLSAMMIPFVTNSVPVFVILKNVGLIDSRTALILLNIAGGISMGILLYTSFIKTIPKELDESAVIDGCNYLQRLYMIIFPLLKPVTVSFAVLRAITVWNDFYTPMLYIRSLSKRTITLMVYTYQSEHVTDWGSIYALMTIALIPPVLFFIFMQKHFYQGITAGSVKG